MSLNRVTGILSVSKRELNLRPCLRGGMSFRWQELSAASEADGGENCAEFVGVMNGRIVVLKQVVARDLIEFAAFSRSKDGPTSADEMRAELVDYFRLDVDLASLYEEWSSRDAKFKCKIATYPDVLCGIRSLRLDPVENLFSFICSSNNNIKRITQMVANMCSSFGELIGKWNGVEYHSFPTIERLSQPDVEAKLRKLSFGYRAKFIHQAAVHIKGKHAASGAQWLHSLRTVNYDQVTQELIKIPGIGKKVADCICLMSLDKLEAIPVDTHVLSIATNMYDFNPNSSKQATSSDALASSSQPPSASKSKNKSLTDKSYRAIGDSFRQLWGKYAGWAQTIMFIDDLKQFQSEKKASLSPTPGLLKRSTSDKDSVPTTPLSKVNKAKKVKT